jgi:hypothetical protein
MTSEPTAAAVAESAITGQDLAALVCDAGPAYTLPCVTASR